MADMEPVNNSNIDEKLAALTMNLQLLSADREADKEKIRALFILAEQNMAETERINASIRENDATIKQILGAIARDAEHIKALAIRSQEDREFFRALAVRSEEDRALLRALGVRSQEDREAIQTLLRVAEIHEARLTNIEHPKPEGTKQ
jgi:hypothetical protein